MIELTSAAVKEIKRMQSSRQCADSYFRLAIAEGGCSGLYYALEMGQTQQNDEQIHNIEGIAILVDLTRFPDLENLRIDYAEDLMGGGFRFHNPNAQTTCSCGLSFTRKA